VQVREVGLRDGLQILPRVLPTTHKLEWIRHIGISNDLARARGRSWRAAGAVWAAWSVDLAPAPLRFPDSAGS
jgi:hypothetical protein